VIIYPEVKGQGLLEYALILMLVALIVIVILALLGPAVGNMYSNIVPKIWNDLTFLAINDLSISICTKSFLTQENSSNITYMISFIDDRNYEDRADINW